MADSTAALLKALIGGATSGYGAATTTGSADINALERTLALNNLYKTAAAPIASAKFDNSLWSTEKTAGVAVGQAFLSALLTGLGQRSEANQLAKITAVLPQLYANPSGTAIPEGVDTQAFEGLRANAIAKAAERKMVADEQIRRSLGERLITMNPDGSVKPTPGSDVMTEVFAKGKKGSAEGSKEFKEMENLAYKRITDLPSYKLLADVDSNIKALPDLAKQDSKASDIGLISTIARIRDPVSTVREGEYKVNADTQAWLDQVYGNWRAVVTGGSRLTAENKFRIIQSVIPKYDELVKSFSQGKGTLLQDLTAQGGDAARVPIPDYKPFDLDALKSSLFDPRAYAERARAQGIPKAQARHEYQKLMAGL